MANDPRIEIPDSVRSMGIFGGLLMIILGLIIGWQKSGTQAELPQTGYKMPPKEPGLLERLAEAALGGSRKT